MSRTGMTRSTLNRTADAMRWLPDALKGRIVTGNATQVLKNFKLGMNADLRDRNGNVAIEVTATGETQPIPDLAERRAWTELVARIAGMAGTQSQALVVLLGELGVRDQSELRDVVEAGKRFRSEAENASLSPREYGNLALDMVERVMRLDDEFAALARERISGRTTGNGLPHVNGDS